MTTLDHTGSDSAPSTGAAESWPLVGLVTIWYRAGEEMGRFPAGLQAVQYPRLEPVFVIHSQSREEVERLQAEVPRAHIIQPGRNLGTAAGWNLGIDALLTAGADYVGIWNVDVTMPPHCIERLVEVMERDRTIGACQPLLLYSDEPGKVEMYGGSVDVRTGLGSHNCSGQTDLPSLPPECDVQYLDGGTMLMRADALQRAGAFDSLYFMYLEDADLCLRMQQAGYRTVAVRDAHAWHHHREDKGSFPTPYEAFYLTRNRFYFVRKHAGWRAWLQLAGRMAWEAPRRVAHYLRRGQHGLVRPYLAGIACGVALRMGRQGWMQRGEGRSAE